MTLHSLLLLLVLFSVAPALFFPLSASASSAADAHPLPTQPARILFSTHSPNPWSRRSRRWSLHQEKGSRVFTMAASNPNGTHSTDPVNSDDLSDGDGHAGVCPFPITLTFKDSVRHFLHKCQGSNNWVARTAAIIAWLLILFYLLGTTASDYFSCTLEKLSDALKLSPAVAGVTLLAIGNGAPDVFSSLAAFVSSDSAGSIGFSCVLGGALYITTVVSGTVALVTAGVCKKSESEKINFVCFVRDALFLLASAGILTVILLDGKVHLWEAISFLSVYVIYAALVAVTEMLENHHGGASSVLDPLLPKATVESSLPQWISFSPKSQHHHHNHLHSQALEAELEYFLEGKKNYSVVAISKRYALLFYKYGIEWPLSLPRCLTIPVVEEERWSRPLAIASCTLAPLFVGSVWILQGDDSTESMYVTLGISGGLGIVLGILAFRNTENAKPPCRFLWLWLAGGFFMSIVWFYLVADQVVASLETLGAIFSIDPAILGLTVLAWGNSVGDLVADLSLACGGRDGVQIAISGCYAGPLFNMLVGLGLSLVIACWKSNPEPLFIADDDGSLFFIVGFLAAGLVWALVMIPLNGMRLSRSFGASLLLLYCVFLVTGMCYAMGWISE